MSDAADLGAVRLLEARGLDLPPGLEIEWLGVSGYRLTYEAKTLFVDPFVSRVPLRSLLLGRTALPNREMIDRYIHAPGDVVGVLVGHTHWDHAVDAPAIAQLHDTKAYGSESLARLMRLHGLGQRAVEVVPGKAYELGPFEVRFIRSRHSKLILGRRVPFAGELTCDHLDGLSPAAYKCGQVWGIQIRVAGIDLFHQGSADLDDEELGRLPVDVFLAGVAGRNFTPKYWERILPRLDPKTVVPTHYDNFFTPLGRDAKLISRVHVDQVPDEVAAVSSDAEVAALRRVDAPSSG
jgi:L-ascorbate metabolism protein UlaG (beta-lactamase superfamily)